MVALCANLYFNVCDLQESTTLCFSLIVSSSDVVDSNSDKLWFSVHGIFPVI